MHDLTTAAAVRDLDLAIYIPAVDRDGFDLIVDDRDTLLPIQLKSVFGRTSKWSVHRRLLRPKRHELHLYGYDAAPTGEGVGGAVILIDIGCDDSFVTPKYLYTDINVLSALWRGIIRRPKPQETVLKRLRKALIAEPGGKIELTRSAFLRPRTPEHLLALAGLHSRFHGYWPDLMYRLLRNEHEDLDLPAPESTVAELLREHLRVLCVDKI